VNSRARKTERTKLLSAAQARTKVETGHGTYGRRHGRMLVAEVVERELILARSTLVNPRRKTTADVRQQVTAAASKRVGW
jgi:hypothetical protein